MPSSPGHALERGIAYRDRERQGVATEPTGTYMVKSLQGCIHGVSQNRLPVAPLCYQFQGIKAKCSSCKNSYIPGIKKCPDKPGIFQYLAM